MNAAFSTNVTTSKLKSILKSSQILDDDDTGDSALQKQERERHAREVAIKHAQTIQMRKEIESQVLDSIVALSEFPLARSPKYSAKYPSSSDIQEFKARIRLFQPSDYDDLIEERNHNNLCGYSLCPNPRIKVAGRGNWKIINTGRKDFNIVPKVDIEKWCSTDCARRALYVKVQLNETAVWERAGSSILSIDLLNEGQANIESLNAITSEMDKIKLDQDRTTVRNLQDLANERGESGRFGAATTRVPVHINPKDDTTESAQSDSESQQDQDIDSHLLIDGYKPRTGPLTT
ncbi:putative RNA polymerase II subunit B1 CTD phosphatase RPAP2 [Ceratocystis lukuohia]|uniref:RNA polymerase II subunit B1 CTD phosphatase RPAP2 homolog n=1 Tax=Ceratocystis lukuohia TaxID=2019550 RepID=A0ABR4MFT1_9PEZI